MAHNSHRQPPLFLLSSGPLYLAVGSETESDLDSKQEDPNESDPSDSESDDQQENTKKRHRFAVTRYETPSPQDKHSLLLAPSHSRVVTEDSSHQAKKKKPRRKQTTTKGRKSTTTEVADPPEISPVSQKLHQSKENRRLARSSSSTSPPESTKMPTITRNGASKKRVEDTDTSADTSADTASTTVTVGELKKMYKASKTEIKRLTRENTELKEEIEDVKDLYDRVMQELILARKKGYEKRNQGYADLVAKKTKRELWRTVKFLSNEATENIATERCLDLMKIREFTLTNDKGKDLVINQKRSDFVATYRGDCREGINEQRSYVQSQMKKVFNKTMEREEVPPSIEDLYKVVTRDIPLPSDTDEAQQQEHERLMTIFLWYWDELLPKCAGNIYWRDSIRRHQCISQATHEGKQCITNSTEGICALMYDNCHDKWDKMWKNKQEDPSAKMPKKKDDPEVDEYAGKYSDSMSGQSKYGGWNPEGLAKFQEVVAQVKAARQTEKSAQLEQICLDMVRHRYKIKADDNAAPAGKRGQKRKKTAPPTVVIGFDEE
jgi:hypothetical protein